MRQQNNPALLLKPLIRVILFTCSFIPSLSFSLPEDNKMPMHITADSSIYNYKTGYTIFEGHVQVTQGSTHLLAERLVTKRNPHHQLTEAIATSTTELAHYWTLPKSGDHELHAQAKIIKIYPLQSNVALENNVILTRGIDTFHGELIIYNRNDQTILIPAKQNSRATLTYNPETT